MVDGDGYMYDLDIWALGEDIHGQPTLTAHSGWASRSGITPQFTYARAIWRVTPGSLGGLPSFGSTEICVRKTPYRRNALSHTD